MPPELRLLLACLRGLHRDNAEELEHALEGEVEWTTFVRSALVHGVTPLLHKGLAAGGERVPNELLDALARHAEQNRNRVDALVRVALDLVDALDRRGIPVILFKGPALAERAHGDRAMRRAGDIDILLHRETVRTACEVLSELGFQEGIEQGTGQPLSSGEWRAVLRYQCELAYTRPHDGVTVEPHWRFAPVHSGIPLRMDGIWRRARPGPVLGRERTVLSLEDLFVVLCVHATKHEWCEVRWVADLDALVRRQVDLDLDAILRHAQAHHCERMLLTGLALSEALLGTPLSEGVRERLESRPRVRSAVRGIVAAIAEGGMEGRSIFELSRLRLGLLDRRRDRLTSAWRTLATPRIEHARMVPFLAPTSPLHVPLKIASDYVAGPIWVRGKQAWRRWRTESRRRRAPGLLVFDQIPFPIYGAGLERSRALIELLTAGDLAVTLHPTRSHEEYATRAVADLPDELEVVWEAGGDELGHSWAGVGGGVRRAARPAPRGAPGGGRSDPGRPRRSARFTCGLRLGGHRRPPRHPTRRGLGHAHAAERRRSAAGARVRARRRGRCRDRLIRARRPGF